MKHKFKALKEIHRDLKHEPSEDSKKNVYGKVHNLYFFSHHRFAIRIQNWLLNDTEYVIYCASKYKYK